jgi:hypothetical protein
LTNCREAAYGESTVIGLCADCQHCRIVKSNRSTFYMCLRSLTDPEYRKYPPLPVLRCPGYEKAPDGKLTQ